ncbi:MAG: hypothetical protein AAGA48_08900 [Myxococcota bacterium]
MQWTVRPINAEARAYLRLRLFRSIETSSRTIPLALGLPLTIAFMVVAPTLSDDGRIMVLWVLLLPSIWTGTVALGLVGFAALMGLAMIVAQVQDRVPRAGQAFYVVFTCFWFGPFMAFFTLVALTGLIAPEDTGRPRWVWALMVASGWLSVTFCWAAFRLYGRMLMLKDDAWNAIKGWRPPTGFDGVTLRRMLGLPPFLASFGRGTETLAGTYLLAALVGLGPFGMLFLPLILAQQAEDGVSGGETAILITVAIGFALQLLGAGRLVTGVANRLATRRYQAVKEWDDRNPIVFLRAFDQDQVRLRARGGGIAVRMAPGVANARTLDELLIEHASPYGPVIAIGDPRDPHPPFGAARVFVRNAGEGWKDVVTALVDASRLVVICPNDSEGVRWELDLLARQGSNVQLVVLANPTRSREANLAQLEEIFGSEVTEPVGRGQVPVAAFETAPGEVCLLTARRPGFPHYAVALNFGLQTKLGLDVKAQADPT